MKVLVVGAGAQGAPCVAILARQAHVSQILLGSLKLKNAASVRDRIGSSKVIAAAMDAGEPESVARVARKLIGTVDQVIDLTPSFCSPKVMRAALALDTHYINTAACPEHLAQLIDSEPLRALQRLQNDVACEPVGHDDVDIVGQHIAALDVADEVHVAGGGEERVRLLHERVALAVLLADRH